MMSLADTPRLARSASTWGSEALTWVASRRGSNLIERRVFASSRPAARPGLHGQQGWCERKSSTGIGMLAIHLERRDLPKTLQQHGLRGHPGAATSPPGDCGCDCCSGGPPARRRSVAAAACRRQGGWWFVRQSRRLAQAVI